MARPRDFGVKSCDFSAPEFETRFSIIESPGVFFLLVCLWFKRIKCDNSKQKKIKIRVGKAAIGKLCRKSYYW